MLTILSVTGPIFILIALGFGAVHQGVLDRSDMKGLGGFVINFALPPLLFNAMAQRSLAEAMNFRLLLAYALGSLGVVAAGLMIVCIVQKRSLRSGAIVTMGMALSNSAFIGFPVAQQLLGKEASAMLALYAAVENMLMLPLLLTLAEIGEKDGGHWTQVMRGILKRLLKNPMILAIILGVGFSASRLSLPLPIARAFDMLSGASAPVALFCIGGTLAGLSLKGMAGDIGTVVIGKLILHPLAVLAAFFFLPFDNPTLKTAAIINAGMPMLSIYPLLGQKYGQEGICAAALVVATIMSFFSISAWLWLTGAG